MDKKQIFFKKGFTLIELLVVIAIIGLLSSMSVYAINVARIKSRDARRMADLKQMRTALSLYYDEYQRYPTYVDSNPSDAGWDHSHMGDGFIRGLEDNARGDNPNNVFFLKAPSDPISTPDGCHCCGVANDLIYTYITASNNQQYELCAAFEDATPDNLVYECANGSYPVYCVREGY
jgi:prepilin-type N-terminal cleavage/methylation domain-containing protein